MGPSVADEASKTTSTDKYEKQRNDCKKDLRHNNGWKKLYKQKSRMLSTSILGNAEDVLGETIFDDDEYATDREGTLDGKREKWKREGN